MRTKQNFCSHLNFYFSTLEIARATCIGLKHYRSYSISWVGCFQLTITLFIMCLRDLGAAGQWVWVCEGWLCMKGKREISKAGIPCHWNLFLIDLPFWNKLALLSSAILTPAELHLVVREGYEEYEGYSEEYSEE